MTKIFRIFIIRVYNVLEKVEIRKIIQVLRFEVTINIPFEYI